MRISKSARFGGAIALGAISASALLGVSNPAWAKKAVAAQVGRIETPLGLQGTRGADARGNVGIIFNLVDDTRKKTDVEVQYGVDVNADGFITDDEYRPATEDRNDSRNTRKNKAPQLFTTAGDIGAIQQYVWKSLADVGTKRFLTIELAMDANGRQIPDPDNPGSFLFAKGPNGNEVFAGVQLRVRAFRKTGTGRAAKKVTGDWVVSDSFALNNNNTPQMTIDSVENNGISSPIASDETVMIHWTAKDADSEDLNGNGQLDIAGGEDANSNNALDCEKVGVAFDFHRLTASENPGSMTPAQIAALPWVPCSRDKTKGDTDSLDAKPGIPLPVSGDQSGVCSAPNGRNYVFAWDSVADVGTAYAKVIFRARPFDEKRENGDYTYFTQSVQLDNWRIFKGDTSDRGALLKLESLASGRVGHTVTQIQSAIDKDAANDRGDAKGLTGFMSVLVAGGAQTVGGAGVPAIDIMSLNTVDAETTTSSRIALSFLAARGYHSATSLDDGRILLVGGFNSTGAVPLATTEIFDPKTATVVAGPTLATARAKHTAVKLSSGDVAIIGGVGAGGAVLNSCELIQFRPFADKNEVPIPPSTWSVVALPAIATAQHTLQAVLLPDQTVLVTGGIDAAGNAVRTAQRLDPLNDNDPNTPTTKNPVLLAVASQMNEARKFGTATPLIDGNVLFAGGSGNAKKTMEVFNWQTSAFEVVDLQMTDARVQHLAVRLGDGSVLLAGGTDDPDAPAPAIVGSADIVKLGIRNAGTGHWAASLLQINGGLSKPRRFSGAAAVDNGRVLIAGGLDASGTLSSLETFTPANGSNRAPTCRTVLPSSEQSWLFGAPVYYRLKDVDLGDRSRVVVQFVDRTPTGDGNWRACSPQSATIGGDQAEFTSDLATVPTDDPLLAIDPIVKNTVGDHAYIWALSRDVVRPAPGTKSQSYNIRVIPQGAITGTLGESSKIDVLFNTKIVPTILPFENIALNRPDIGKAAGALTPNQGGDIRVWVHLRDVDGGVVNGVPQNGDDASCLFEFAVDKNNDGQISPDGAAPEFWFSMTAAGAPTGHATSLNPQTGLKTYYNGAFPNPAQGDAGSDPAFGARPASKGWTSFDWDSVRDLGVPVTTFSNVWIRVTPSDSNAGFVRLLRNTTGAPPALTIIKHPDSLYLLSWRPRFSNNKNSMPVNDYIDLTFNGQINPSSLSSTAIQVFRGTGTTSQVRGSLSVTNNADNTAVVTFYPDPQSTNLGSVVYGQTAASTVFFPNDDYSIRIPGYTAPLPGPPGTGDPQVNPATGPTLRPLVYTQPLTAPYYSTYRLIQAVPISSGQTFHTANVGVYANDLALPGAATSSLTALTVLAKAGTGGLSPATPLTFSFGRALDFNTVASPNITVTLVGNTTGGTKTTVPVVPGRWTVTNTPLANGASNSVLTFVPLFQLPSTLPPALPPQVTFSWNTGLKGVNGNAVTAGSITFNAENYVRTTRTNFTLETFTDTNPATNQNDTAVTTAVWGTDGCALGAVSGGAAGLTVTAPPTGKPDLNVTSNTTLSLAQNDYNNITVSKGITLTLNSQAGQVTLNATGNVTINGTVTFSGANGAMGSHGYTSYPYPYYGPGAGTRTGGSGRNGGGNGGNSAVSSISATPYRFAGTDGTDGAGATGSKGQGGLIATETSSSSYYRYIYGAGGGGGGGNALAGLGGGRAMTQFSATSYGAASAGGNAGGDQFFTTVVNGGGGGGGGGSTVYPGLGQQEGGAGGAGAGGVTFNVNGTFTLAATGTIVGRGGNGGSSSHSGGSGGGGAGGSLRILAKTKAVMDGVVDLRGGLGGAKGWSLGTNDSTCISNVSTEKTARYGGDGAPGRLVVVAPNFVSADEVRVFGQLYVRQITSLPTTSIGSASAPPFGLDGSTTTTTYNFFGASSVRWSSLTVAAGSVIDLRNDTATGSNNPVQIFVDNAVNIAGTLRINGNSASPAGPNYTGQQTYPNNLNVLYNSGAPLSYGTGMSGNMGGGKGGDGYTLGSNAYGTEAGDGSGPAPGVHNMKSSTGWYNGNWYFYSGDSGGSGGANATDGEDGWAAYAVGATYNYLGAFNDTSAVGSTSQSGQTTSTAPRRIGFTSSADATTLVITNLSSFVGSGGGGGNSAFETYTYYMGIAGLGGGGAGAIGIVSSTATGSVSITGTVEARGGTGQTPGYSSMWSYPYAHAGGGGGSGGTVYIASNTISIGAVTPASGLGGATFDLRGGDGGGHRGTNSVVNLQAYPEYQSVGSFGGAGGYGRLVLAVTPTGSVNGVANVSGNLGKQLANKWGMYQTSYDTASNTVKTLAGTANFYCPGFTGPPLNGTKARSKWYDLKSISPIVDAFKANVVINASLTTSIEGAQSAPNTPGTAVPPIGVVDANNTSGLIPVPATTGFLKGWRWIRFELNFTKTTTTSGGAVVIDDMLITYTSDL